MLHQERQLRERGTQGRDINVNATGTFPVRNGQTTGSLTIAPISTLTCTGNQQVRILSASYDLTLTGDGLPPVHLTS